MSDTFILRKFTKQDFILKRLLLAGALLVGFSQVSFADCFAEGDKIIADGVLHKETFPGPPNYESIESGDSPETVWVVDLDGPVTCANGAPEWGSRQKMQVILNSTKPDDFEKTHVSVYGSLSYAETGHHHTPLLVDATSITEYSASAKPDGKNTPNNPPQNEPGQLTVEKACTSYMLMTNEAYLYVNDNKKEHIEKALEYAGNLYLAPNYIDYIVNAMQTNQRDYYNASTVHSMLSSKEQNSLAMLACTMNPGRTIPNWNALVHHDLIAK